MDRDDGVGGGPWRTLGEEHEEGEGEAEDRQKIEGILDGEKIGEFGIAKATNPQMFQRLHVEDGKAGGKIQELYDRGMADSTDI